MDIFQVRDNKVSITPEVLLIEPFKSIWEVNETSDAIMRFTYIEFMCSMKKANPFIGYKEEERGIKILNNTFPNASEMEKKMVMLDALVIAAIEIYNELQLKASPSIRFYNSAIAAADNLIDFFNTFDLNATNARNGSLLYKPNDVTRALKDTNDVIKTLGSLKQKVLQELYEDAKGKAGREINYFEKSKSES